MRKKLEKNEFFQKLQERTCFLYQVPQIANTDKDYVRYALEFLEKELTQNPQTGEWELIEVSKNTRESSYQHSHSVSQTENSPREEELFVRDMFLKGTDINGVFGKLIDYQVPLKNKRGDKAGKIDFIYEKDGEFCFAEIKTAANKESILRAILEIQTYYQLVDKEKLLMDFGKSCEMPIRKKVVVFVDSSAYYQWNTTKKFRDLAERLAVDVVFLKDQPIPEIFERR